MVGAVKIALVVVVSIVAGAILEYLICAATIRKLRRRVRELRNGKPRFTIQSVTRFIFVTAQVFAIIWVSWSYIISTYATVVLEQAFPAEELSKEAVRTILGVGVLKVVENIFEHNEGPVFGRNPTAAEPPPEETETEGEG